MSKRNDKMKEYYRKYDYNSRRPVHVNPDDLTDVQRYRLMESDHFCMIPWTHIHGFPTGEAYPCCLGEMEYPIGNMRENSLEEIWHGDKYTGMRQQMLDDKPCVECTRCYEQEKNGFFSMRNSHNKHFGHHIGKVDQGIRPEFNIVYWDIRFSNQCNLKCRSCGPMFSSLWYDDHVAMYGRDPGHKRIERAGRTKTDIWEQMEPQIDNIEQIYFAGGEPLIMQEHYNILKELVRRERFDVRLIYNSNFQKLVYKDLDVLEYWKLFENVSIGASLDAMGDRAELIRKGTDWNEVLRNRERMLKVCPEVDFYISPTMSIMNVFHVHDFHRDWVNRGFLKHSDLNVNILQSPEWYRADCLPQHMKQDAIAQIKEHMDWLEPHDTVKRAINGFNSTVTFLEANDNTQHLAKFNDMRLLLDGVRDEDFYSVLPELKELATYA
jgi:radical SAM protein with 4Fe4S-binding SPASM domain